MVCSSKTTFNIFTKTIRGRLYLQKLTGKDGEKLAEFAAEFQLIALSD
jgi:hypothetical protein